MFKIINFKIMHIVCKTINFIFQAVYITLKLLENDEK